MAKRTPKKKDILQHFGKKTKITRTFLNTNEDLGDELVIVVIDNDKSGLFII